MVDILDTNIPDEMRLFDGDLDLNDDEFHLLYANTDFSEDLLTEPMIFSQESCPVVTPVESILDNIPTNQNEWMVTDQLSKRKRPPRLYEFLILLLQNPRYASYASYSNVSEGIFQIHKPDQVAVLWEQVKNRQSTQKMTYDKFARAVRWYYKQDIMIKTNTRYTFQFSPATLKQFNSLMDFS